MEQHLLSALVHDRHQELIRIAAEAARGRPDPADAVGAVRRPLRLRLLDRMLGPR